MSETSPYQAPAAVASPAPVPAQQRPTGVTVFGILSIVLGIFGLMGTVFGAVAIAISGFIETGPNPTLDAMQGSFGYQVFSYISIFLGAVFHALLVVAGVGMLKMRPWSRKLSVVYSLYTIIATIAGMVVNVAVAFGPALSETAPGPDRMGVMVGMIFTVVGSVIGIIYPIALLIYCWRRQTIATFESWR